MTELIVLEQSTEIEYVCTNCKHFMKLEDSFYCSFFSAFLSEKSLSIPCDFLENINEST